MWRWLTILAFMWSTPVSAEEQPKVLDIFDPTDIVKHYIGPVVPEELITKFKSIKKPSSSTFRPWKFNRPKSIRHERTLLE